MVKWVYKRMDSGWMEKKGKISPVIRFGNNLIILLPL
jgi:hypothetical protein